MHDMMKKLLEKKMKGKKMLSDPEKEAKMSVLKDLKGSMDEVLADKINGMKKVSVMSDSKEGLEEGLEKAQDIVENPSEIMPEEMMEESEEELSLEDIDERIAELMALKEKLQS